MSSQPPSKKYKIDRSDSGKKKKKKNLSFGNFVENLLLFLNLLRHFQKFQSTHHRELLSKIRSIVSKEFTCLCFH